MIDVEVVVQSELWTGVCDVETLARRAVEVGSEVAGRSSSERSELSVVLADDAQIRELNRVWRGKDSPTNVLSFPAASQRGVQSPKPLGDIALAFETVRREAEAEGKRLADHATHLIVHGFLHLLGFNHERDASAEEMEALEIEALRRLCIANPYSDVAA